METKNTKYFNYDFEDDDKKSMSSTEIEQLKTDILTELNESSEPTASGSDFE